MPNDSALCLAADIILSLSQQHGEPGDQVFLGASLMHLLVRFIESSRVGSVAVRTTRGVILPRWLAALAALYEVHWRSGPVGAHLEAYLENLVRRFEKQAARCAADEELREGMMAVLRTDPTKVLVYLEDYGG